MLRPINIKATNKQELFLAYLKTINWTLPEQLTDSELEILSYLLLYNDFYFKEIKNDTIRYDLLFSSTIKKKLREEFGLDTQKFEVYLNKLRKKQIIVDNKLSSKVIIYCDNKLGVTFNIEIKEAAPKVVEVPKSEPLPVITEMPEIAESTTINDTDEDPL